MFFGTQCIMRLSCEINNFLTSIVWSQRKANHPAGLRLSWLVREKHTFVCLLPFTYLNVFLIKDVYIKM